ncbi:hypothetical protein BDV27DRAFT_121145 [Aspergillus caelatus]|uniref:Uncharacterized protein n=1 Tax=Aspergillus caelatus TaxID=61420 RepID=A0A5N7AHJ0_9EURO|nr:uncharacterized protein BDV27DRAFT_121145 [Aspergillus caelatus]KAE8369357.1 hypothetical protein BDV27DRAFT_121145 [Aspergillus caelatus]
MSIGFGVPFRSFKAKPWMNVVSLLWPKGSVELCNISAPHIQNRTAHLRNCQ